MELPGRCLRSPRMRPFWKLSAAGFAATAITYGPARMGFGLFVPQFKQAFSISTQTAGLISSLGFVGLLVGLLVSQSMTDRKGPRMPVLAGLLIASTGMAVVAVAPDPAILSLGVLLAVSSAGFAWTPFNNAVHRQVADMWRPGAFSLVSTGTGLGIAAAGLAALAMSLWGVSWRVSWSAFAIGGLLAAAVAWVALRGVAGSPGPGRPVQWRRLLTAAAIPLLGIGLCFGATSSIYITFAVDRIAGAGGVAGLSPHASGGAVFICYGLFGLLGLLTGSAKAALGLPWLLRLLMLTCAASFAALAFLPATWVGVVLSAGLQGMTVMMMSAVLAFWSDRLFPALPSQSFTAVLLAVSAGSVIGPALAGVAADTVGAKPMFIATATFAAATAAAVRYRHIRERPEASMA